MTEKKPVLVKYVSDTNHLFWDAKLITAITKDGDEIRLKQTKYRISSLEAVLLTNESKLYFEVDNNTITDLIKLSEEFDEDANIACGGFMNQLITWTREAFESNCNLSVEIVTIDEDVITEMRQSQRLFQPATQDEILAQNEALFFARDAAISAASSVEAAKFAAKYAKAKYDDAVERQGELTDGLSTMYKKGVEADVLCTYKVNREKNLTYVVRNDTKEIIDVRPTTKAEYQNLFPEEELSNTESTESIESEDNQTFNE